MSTTRYEGIMCNVDDNGNVVEFYPLVLTDTSLQMAGRPADSAAVGRKLDELQLVLENVNKDMEDVKSELETIKRYLETENTKHTITYQVDTDVVYSEEFNNGVDATKPTSFVPEKEGYEFVGWKDNATANEDVLLYKLVDGDSFTLYAVFKKTITLSYDGNGSTSGDSTSQTGAIYYNGSGHTTNATFVVANNEFTKTAHEFGNWALGSVDGSKYSAGESVTLTENGTLYAIWTPISAKIWSGDIEPYGTSELDMPITCGTFDLTNHNTLTLNLKVENPNLEATVSVYLNGVRVIEYSHLQFTNKTDVEKSVDISGYDGNQTITINRGGHDNATIITGSITIAP